MGKRAPTTVVLSFLITVTLVVGLSYWAVQAWPKEPEGALKVPAELVLTPEMTAQQAQQQSGVTNLALKEALGLASQEDKSKTLAELGLTPEEAKTKLAAAMALQQEHATKDFRKIGSKFVLWAAFLTLVFIYFKRRLITPGVRLLFLAFSLLVFGVLYGADVSPMGTVKDAIVLWGRDKVVFPPRLIAFAIFLIGILIANKFTCGWGCQFGALQDFVFRLNRNEADTQGVMAQWKPPFALTNTIRTLFFIGLVVAAIGWGKDLIEPLDPFKTFNPAAFLLSGAVFVGILLALSLFIYRPWCHFCCPFGLIGWVFERFSRNRIRVDYDTCIACEQCAKACPSTVMEAILKQNRTVPDCFACAACMQVCPTKSIHFDGAKREAVPEGKFAAKEEKSAPAQD